MERMNRNRKKNSAQWVQLFVLVCYVYCCVYKQDMFCLVDLEEDYEYRPSKRGESWAKKEGS